MTKQEILEYFKDINEAYNDSSRHDSLKRMLDELLKEHETAIIYKCPNCRTWVSAENVVRCKDCRNYNGFSCENMKNERMIGMIVADDWFCADGKRKDGGD